MIFQIRGQPPQDAWFTSKSSARRQYLQRIHFSLISRLPFPKIRLCLAFRLVRFAWNTSCVWKALTVESSFDLEWTLTNVIQEINMFSRAARSDAVLQYYREENASSPTSRMTARWKEFRCGLLRSKGQCFRAEEESPFDTVLAIIALIRALNRRDILLLIVLWNLWMESVRLISSVQTGPFGHARE